MNRSSIRSPLARCTAFVMLAFAFACRGAQVVREGSAQEARAAEAEALSLALIGEPAPDFTLPTISGSSVRLSDYRGKVVVLEWLNPRCPFTRHAHNKGLLKDYPREAQSAGVVWLGINSGATQKLGGGIEASERAMADWAIEFPILQDLDGSVGRRFDATMTPEVFLIDQQGVLRYVGALDNMPFGKVRGGGEGQNYLALALEQLLAGETVKPTNRQAYGCRVKYAQPTRQD